MSEKQINSLIDGVREFPIKLAEDKAKTIALEPGRNYVKESEYKMLLKNKGFKKMLETGQFEEPDENKIKTDAEKLKAEKEFSTNLAEMKKNLTAEHKKAMKDQKDKYESDVADLQKKLENSNTALIKATSDLEKAKNDLATLKKAKQ